MSFDEDNAPDPAVGPFLGLDIGARRIGVARADAATRIAIPAETVDARRSARPAEYIADLLAEHRCKTIVVGWPLTLEGEEGRATQKVQKFMDRLIKVIAGRQSQAARQPEAGRQPEDARQPETAVSAELPQVIRWDERMTTTAAESFLIGADVSRSRRKKVVDQIAATHILQGYLDSL